MTSALSSLRRRAFTLIELLVVISLLMLMLALVMPATGQILAAMNLSRAGQQIVDQLLLARQTAITRNRQVEVRFIEIDSQGTKSYRAIQAWLVDETGENKTAIGKVALIPESVKLNTSSTLSPLLFGNGATLSGRADFASYGTCQFVGFRFRPNGETDVPAKKNSVDFITLQETKANGDPPPNFFGIKVHPITGRVDTFQP